MIEQFSQIDAAAERWSNGDASYDDLEWIDERAGIVDEFGDSRAPGFLLQYWHFAPEAGRPDEFLFSPRQWFWREAKARDEEVPSGEPQGWGIVSGVGWLEGTVDAAGTIESEHLAHLSLRDMGMLEAMLARRQELTS